MKHYSKQREAILEILKNSYHHPTAEEIYQKTLDSHLGMSKSTVYRNLNLLAEEKKIIKFSVQAGPDRYDYLREKHHHAICTVCGKVYDWEEDTITDQIAEVIQKQLHMEMVSEPIVIQGVCEKCQ